MDIILVGDPHFDPNSRERRRNELLNSSDPAEVAYAIHYMIEKPSTEKLNAVYERFGGIEAFTAKSLNSDLKNLRNILIQSKNFPSETFKEVFDKTLKVGRDDAFSYAAQFYFLTDLDKFMRVWNANKTEALRAIVRIHRWEHGRHLREHQPMVHAEDCRGDEPGNALAHYFCKRPVVYRPDRSLAFQLKAKQEFETIAASEVIDFVQENILGCSAVQRELYAESLIVRSDHWKELARDPKRDVLNAVAQNVLLPADVALDIVTSHKTPYLREAIAVRSVDRNLLNIIWSGTKSESIREAVESNALFSRI